MVKKLVKKITGKRPRNHDLDYQRAEHQTVNREQQINSLSIVSYKDHPDHLSRLPLREKGSTLLRGGWQELKEVYGIVCEYDGTRDIIENSGWSKILSIHPPNGDRAIVEGLIDRWWDITHNFHLPMLEITITPLDFVMLTGLSIGKGDPPPFDARVWKEDMELTMSTYLWRLGEVFGPTFDDMEDSLQLDLRGGGISVKVLKDFIYSLKGKNGRGIDEDIARFFMVWVIGQIFFPNKNSSVSLGWLSAFEDLSVVGTSSFAGVESFTTIGGTVL